MSMFDEEELVYLYVFVLEMWVWVIVTFQYTNFSFLLLYVGFRGQERLVCVFVRT